MRVLIDLDAQARELDDRLTTQLAVLAQVIRENESGERIDAICADIDATERDIAELAKRQYQQRKYLERRHAKAMADERAIDALVAQGMHAEDARAQVTGVDVEKLRKREFLRMVRDNGITAVGFDDAVRQWHMYLLCEVVESLEHQYSDHFRGARFLTPQAERAGESVVNLWFMSHARVRQCASSEMLSWFDEHGRLTRDDVRRQALGLSRTPDAYYSL